jgi:hypothetical protein
MKVFWSWQNDYLPDTCRHFIRAALVEAIAAAGQELGLEDSDRPEIDHDTKDTPGMAEITKTILDKISRSAVFVADLTPIGKTDGGKALPNPNVLIELGWALSQLGPERIIAVLNTASGYNPDHLPFDIRHRRAMPYELAETADGKTKKDAKKALVKDLTAALKTNLGQYVEDKAAAQDVKGVPTQADDPSIWATASAQLEHNDAFGHGSKTSIAMPKCPRGYIRIIPAGWKNGVPGVSAIAKLQNGMVVRPRPEGGTNGNFGVCKEGFVQYWETGDTADGKAETRNVSMYFDETGEYWVLHGKAIGEGKYGQTLNVASLIVGWSKAITATLQIYKTFEALPVVKIEAGLFGAENVRWPEQWNHNSPITRKDRCVLTRQLRDWNDEAQLNFLTDAYNKVRDLFGLPRASVDDLRAMIKS